MKLCTTAFFLIAFVPAFSEAKAPQNLRRLHNGPFNGDDQGRYGYSGHPDNSEFFDESHRSNQMMGGPDGSEFFGDFGPSSQMMGGGGGAGGGGPEFVAIECDATNVCDRPDGDAGTWVCRGMTHPVTGEALSRAICIPNNHAWTTDECGCCMDETGADLECPVLPDFITLQCANNTQPDMPYGMAGLHGNWHNRNNMTDSSRAQFICRDLINPFTGAAQPTTLFVPQDRAIDGDICGCCNGNCTFSAEHMFERPPFVEKSCAADTDNYITCELPPRANGGDGNVTEGFFVCRERFDPQGQGESRKEALCIHGDRAFETDECGCCGQECPKSLPTVDIDCSADADSECPFNNGDSGVFVCRTIIHPFDGQVRERSFCIPPDRAWITDVCGCCDTTCPTAYAGGFDDEATQFEAMALEVPDDAYVTAPQQEATSAGSSRAFACSLGTLTSSILIATGMGMFW